MNHQLRVLIFSILAAILSGVVLAVIEARVLFAGPLSERLLFQSSPAENALRIGLIITVFLGTWVVLTVRAGFESSAQRISDAQALSTWLVSHQDKAYLVVDNNGVIRQSNAAAALHIGLPADRIAGRHFTRFFNRVEQEKGLEFPLKTALDSSPEIERLKLVSLPENSDVFHAEFRRIGTGYLIEIDVEQLPGTVSRDLIIQHDRLSNLLKNIPMLVIAIEPTAGKAIWNSRLTDSFGWVPQDGIKADELISKLFSEPEVAAEVSNRFQASDGQPFEVEFTCPTGEKCIQSWTVISLPDGTRIGSGQDVTSQRASLNEIQASEKKYRHLVENMQDGLVVVSPRLIIEYVNPGLCRMFDRTAEEITGRSLVEILSTADIQRLNHQLDLARDSLARPIQVTATLDGGNPRVVTVTPTPIYGNDGKYQSSFSIVSDVTEQTKSRELLRVSEERLNMALMGAADGLWDYNVATGEVHRSSYIPSHLGYSDEDIAASIDGWTAILHPDDRDRVIAAFNDLVEGREENYEAEQRLRSRDGKWLWILDKGWVVERDNEGRPKRLIGIHKDIDEQIRSRETLRRTEEQLRAIFETAEDAIFIKNLDRVYTHVSPGMAKLFGCSADELIGLTDREMLGPEPEYSIQEDERVLRGETVREERIKEIGGREYLLHVVKVPLRDKDGNITGICGIARDISERFGIERQLAASEEKFRLLAENTMDVIVRYDHELRHVYVNPAFLKLNGLAEEDVLGRSHRERGLPEEICTFFETTLGRVFDSGKPETGQILFQAQGRQVAFEVNFVPEGDGDGTVKSVLTTGREITKLKQIEAALRQSEEQYRTLVDLMPDGIATTDPDLNLAYANRSFCRMLGYECRDIIGKPTADFLDNDNFWILKTQSERRESGELGSYELTWRHRLGHDVITRVSPAPVHRINGTVHSSAIISDITAYKTAEQALRDSQEYTRAVIESSPIGITVRDPNGRLLDYNPAWQRLWGVTEEDIKSELSDKASNLYNRDWNSSYLEAYLPQVWKVYEEGGNLFLPDLQTNLDEPGKAWWVSHYFYAIKDEDGKVDRVVTMTEDITARKLAEEALRDSEEFSRAVIDNSPIGITVRTATGKLMSYNQAWQKLWNIPDDDVSQDLSCDREALVFNERDDYLAPFHDEIRRVYSHGGNLFIPEVQANPTRPGAARWVSSYFYAIRDSQGQVDRVVILTEDITARKRAEEEREQLISELRTALSDIKTLRGLLPICAHCKKIRDDQGYWNKLESYIGRHSEAAFSHGICPECARKYYSDLNLDQDGEDD